MILSIYLKPQRPVSGGFIDGPHGTRLIFQFLLLKKILASRRLDINPDNIATPIAASLGDLVTLGELF